MAGILALLLQVLVLLCTTLLAVALLFVSWHRWKFPRGHERILAFFHPHCAAAGGGERVLWAILQALGEIDQQGLPIKVVIYTIDPPSPTYKNGESCRCAASCMSCVGRSFCFAQCPSIRLPGFFSRCAGQGEGEVPAFHTVHTADILCPLT